MRIGVDIDEVLTAFTEPYLEFFNERHGLRLTKDDFVHYNFDEITGVPLHECIKTCEIWAENEGNCSRLEPYPDALPALKQLKAAGHELFIVSGRHAFSHATTHTWIAKHFPGIFSSIFFISFRAHDGNTKTKADVCAEHNITLLIDDDPHYIEGCKHAGVQLILLEQPWNKTVREEQGVHKAKDWSEIKKIIERGIL